MSRFEKGTAVANDIDVEAEARAALQAAEGHGRFESLKPLRAVHSWLLALDSESEDGRAADRSQITHDQTRFLTLGAATGAVLDDEQDRWETQGLLDYWYSVLYRAGRQPSKPRLARLDEKLLRLDDAACPYLGLDAFREADSRLFFGRKGLREALLAKLADLPLLAVMGTSGSGKSSVVQAGLIPALRSGTLPESASWTILPPIVPGSDPLRSLARLILHHCADALSAPAPAPPAGEPIVQLANGFREDARRLATLLNQPGGPPVVVVVDQFEEVFTLCDDPKAAMAFIGNLVELVRTESGAPPKNRVILTMRDDFEDHVLKYPELHLLFDAGRVTVTPMEREELRLAIEQPAQQVGLVFENGVVDALLDDTFAARGALPLLQFALLKLWEGRRHNKVSMEAYRKLGGSRQALRTTADKLFEDMSPEKQQAAKRIFLRIVRPSDGLEVTNKRIPLRDLLPKGEDHTRTREVLDELVNARLVRLTPGSSGEDTQIKAEDTQIEVAHEALVRNWPRLGDWLGDHRAAIKARQRLELKVAEWDSHGRGRDALLDKAQLHDAKSWLDSEDAVVLGVIPGLSDLVDASQKAINNQQRHQDRLLFLLKILAAVAVGAFIIAFIQRGTALKESKNARIAFKLADEAYVRFVASKLLQLATYDRGNSDRSLLLAQKAGAALDSRHLPITDQVKHTLEGLARQPALKFDISYHERSHLYYSYDGKLLATSTYGADAALWDADTGRNLWALPGTANEAVMAIAFSPGGGFLATVNLAGSARIWKIGGEPPRRIRTLSGGHRGAIFGVAFSPVTGHNRLATSSQDGMVIIWDGDTGEQTLRLSGHSGPVYAVAYAPDGRRLATCGADGTVLLWDTSNGKNILALRHAHGAVTAVAFDPNGNYLATTCRDAHVYLWDIKQGTIVKSLPSGQVNWYGGLAFSPDGKTLATSGIDKTIVVKLWSIPSGEMQFSVTIGDDRAHALAFRPDLKRFAVACPGTSATGPEASSSSIISPGQGQAPFADKQAVKIFEIRKMDNPLESIRRQVRREFTLEDYLETLEDLSPNHYELMAEARTLAEGDDIKGAMAKIKEALKLPGLDLNVEPESQRLAVDLLVQRGRALAQEGKSDEAVEVFRRAQALAPGLRLNPEDEVRRWQAVGLLEEGQRVATRGDYERAAELFRKAKALNNGYEFDPDALAKELAAPAVVNRGLRLVTEGKVAEAIAAFRDAQNFDPKLKIRPGAWNNLCWWGSLYGKAADVLFAGERAVELAPADDVNSFRDTRGLARALTGHFQQAIEDFEAMLNEAKSNPGTMNKEEIADRRRWIEALKAGRNPFDAGELDRIRKKDSD